MRLPLLPVIVWILINLGLDSYILGAITHRCPNNKWLKWVHIVLSILLLGVVVTAIALPRRSGDDSTLLAITWLLFIYLTFYLPKYIFIIIDLLGYLPKLWGRSRWKIFTRIGAATGIIIFALLWWGTLLNRFRIDVREITVQVKNLPRSFEGYRIVQFSDFHVGTYGENTRFVETVVEKINELHPDAIFFTGDIVNRRSRELRPFINVLGRLEAPDGVKAILGNHDYGDYFNWSTPAEKERNMEELYAMFEKMGWHLLRNQTEFLVHGNDSIAVIGVENIGDPPFPVYGSLSKAYPNLQDKHIKILLSHNPSHWVDSIKNNPEAPIDLTLSGHTHAMQISAGRLWSPASLRYETWGGEYFNDKGEKPLYVNIGMGTVGLPMRIGATPEITVITLKRAGE